MSNDPFDNVNTEVPAFQMLLAKRVAVPAQIALWGFSDSGKTYSALRLARGLVGPKGKIAVIDTENKRALFYADKFGGWFHIDLQPPFTAPRYTMAVNAAINGGADIIIIDSMSHVWNGEGGVLDQADASKIEGLAKWKTPKVAYARMKNAVLRAPIPIIYCIRAKEKFAQQKNEKGKTEVIHTGQAPICDAGFLFEMTVSVRMESGEHKPLFPVKIPAEIVHAIKSGEYISEESGQIIAAWLAGGAQVDHETEAFRREARDIASLGSVKAREWWGKNVTKAKKPMLTPILAELEDLWNTADREIAEDLAEGGAPEEGGDDALEDKFTGKGQAA